MADRVMYSKLILEDGSGFLLLEDDDYLLLEGDPYLVIPRPRRRVSRKARTTRWREYAG